MLTPKTMISLSEQCTDTFWDSRYVSKSEQGTSQLQTRNLKVNVMVRLSLC